MISRGIDTLFKKPEGMMLMMMGLTPDTMKPLVKPFLLAMAPEVRAAACTLRSLRA